MVDYTKMSKKNARYYSRDYFNTNVRSPNKSYLKSEFCCVSGINHVVQHDNMSAMDGTGQVSDRFVCPSGPVLVQVSGGSLSLVAASAYLGKTV